MERNQKIEDYMRVIYRLRENGLVRGAYIARELGVTKPTVSVALREMEAAGYLYIQPDRTVELTEKGEKIGEYVIKRYATIYSLLTDLGVDKKIADADACSMEHGISEESLKALCDLRQFLQVIRQLSLSDSQGD
ncbi:MAG: metal-dependent transcriptional regulator [Ruminococcus sp.]|nr:metal-dependent transcriptional regulator [Ruminococcus sp.]